MIGLPESVGCLEASWQLLLGARLDHEFIRLIRPKLDLPSRDYRYQPSKLALYFILSAFRVALVSERIQYPHRIPSTYAKATNS